MSSRLLSQLLKISTALAPAADRFNANPATDVYNLALYGHIAFIHQQGAGATGTATITVEACTSAAGAGNTAIAFSYRLGDADGQNLGALTEVTSSGYTTVAADENTIVIIEINAEDLPDGKPFVRLQYTEVANDPVAAGCLAVLSEGRFIGDTLPTAVA